MEFIIRVWEFCIEEEKVVSLSSKIVWKKNIDWKKYFQLTLTVFSAFFKQVALEVKAKRKYQNEIQKRNRL